MANVTFDLIGNPVIVPPLGLDGSSGIKYDLNLPSDVSGSITIQGNFFTQRPAVGQSATLVKMGPINLQVTTTAATANTNGNYIYLVKYTITQDSIDYTGYYANPTSYPNPTGLFYVNSYVDPLYPYTDLAFVNIVLQRSDVSTQAWRLWINGDPTDWPTTPYGDDVLGQEIFVGCSGQQEEPISNVAVTGTAGQFSCTSTACGHHDRCHRHIDWNSHHQHLPSHNHILCDRDQWFYHFYVKHCNGRLSYNHHCRNHNWAYL